MLPIVDISMSDGSAFLEKILSRSQLDTDGVLDTVSLIVKNVKADGDNALFAYTKQFDNADINSLNVKVSDAEIDNAYRTIQPDLLNVIRRSIKRISDFHLKQKSEGWLDTSVNGEILGQIVRPVDSAGVYVPAKKAALPSSVIMNVVPAKIAGVKRIIMATPPLSDGSVDPSIIVAANETGVSEIFKVGGAQAIAGLAFGTESIPRVDKIVGPGNIYVALAKKCVFGYVGIDSVAGPSEILIIADNSANPAFVAADLLSQAEHDELASAICITNDKDMAKKIAQQVELQIASLSRADTIKKSLSSYGAIIIVPDILDAFSISNKIAPEHLELCCADPFALLPNVKNAGAIFLGNYSPEPLGDYMAGPNHVLPTGSSARFFSPLSVSDFVKKSSVIFFDKPAMEKLASDVQLFANAENLTAHANAVSIRLEK